MGHKTNCRTAVFYSYNNSHKFVSFSRTLQVSAAGDKLANLWHTNTDTLAYIYRHI